MNGNSSGERILERIEREVPRGPGVYSFLDSRGTILYVGKSIDLRRRMSSYFARSSPRVGGRLKMLIFNTCDFSLRETGSELLALLLEDKLIKKHRPHFNKRLKDHGKYRYLRFSVPPFPALLDAGDPGRREGLDSFGPFPDGSYLHKIMETVRTVLGLRSCSDPVPAGQCLRSGIGACSGPCRENVSETEYGRIVSRVVDYVNGDDSRVCRILTRLMTRSADSLDFEKAAQMKDLLDFNRRFCARQRFIRDFKKKILTIRERNPSLSAHVFFAGRLQVPDHESPDAEIKRAIAGDRQPTETHAEDARFVHDRAAIVFSWIEKNRDRAAIDMA